MKRNAYTIAEVLVTMLIVGIVASLSLPVLVTDSKKQAYAGSLAAAISNFEMAMSTLLMKEGAMNLFETKAWLSLEHHVLQADFDQTYIKRFMGEIGKTLGLENYDSPGGYYPKGVASVANPTRSAAVDIIGSKPVYETKNGVAYMIAISNPNTDNRAKTELDTIANGTKLTSVAAEVVIDVNGRRSPNIIGRDIFFFLLGADGVLYPEGSADVSYYKNNNVNTWSYNSGDYACTDTNKGRNARGCTARLIDNNFKFDY